MCTVWNYCGMWSQLVAHKHAYCTHRTLSPGWFFLLFGIRGWILDCHLMVCWIGSLLPDHNWNMSHFAYTCKMRCPLNLVLENSEYLWFYWTFCIVILDCGLKLHKLSNHTLVMLQKWLEIHKIIVWSSHCILFSAIFATEKFQKKMSTLSLKLNYSSPRHQTAVFKVLISFKCS